MVMGALVCNLCGDEITGLMTLALSQPGKMAAT